MWALFSGLSAASLAWRRLGEKKLSNDSGLPAMTIGWLTRVFALPPLAVFYFGFHYRSLIDLPWDFWWPLGLVVLVFYPLFTYFYYRSIGAGELSEVLPIMSLIPVLTLVSAWFLRGEEPTLWGVIGIIFITTGIYVLHFEKPADLGLPLKALVYSRPSRHMLYVSLILGLATSFDKLAIQAGGPYAYSFFNIAGGGLALYLVDKISSQGQKPARAYLWKPENIGLGILESVTSLFLFLALASGSFIAYIIAVRNLNVPIAAALGLIVLKEN